MTFLYGSPLQEGTRDWGLLAIFTMYLTCIWHIFLKMEVASSAKIVWSLRHQNNAFSSSDVTHLLLQIHFSNQSRTSSGLTSWISHDISWHFMETQAAVSSCDAADHLIRGFHRCRGWDDEWTDMNGSRFSGCCKIQDSRSSICQIDFKAIDHRRWSKWISGEWH